MLHTANAADLLLKPVSQAAVHVQHNSHIFTQMIDPMQVRYGMLMPDDNSHCAAQQIYRVTLAPVNIIG